MADSLMGKLIELGLNGCDVTTPYRKAVAALESAHAEGVLAHDAYICTPKPEQQQGAKTNEGAQQAETLMQSSATATSSETKLDANPALDQRESRVCDTTTSDNLRILCQEVRALARSGRLEDAIELAEEHEPAYRRDWIESAPEGSRAISCGNELERQLSMYLIGDKPHTILPDGLERLYTLMANVCTSLARYMDAINYLVTAQSLNPASFDAKMEAEYLATLEHNLVGAQDLISEAWLVASTTEQLACVYRRWGHHAILHGQYDFGFTCYAYALTIDDSPANNAACTRVLQMLQDGGYDCSTIPSLEELTHDLSYSGYPVNVSDIVWLYAKQNVEAAKTGPLPDLSYVVANMTRRTMDGESIDDLREMAMMVTTLTMGSVALSDYLYKPILISGDAVAKKIEGANLAPANNNDELSLAVVPYVDKNAGLRFDVMAVCRAFDHDVVSVVPATKRITIAAEGCEEAQFQLLRQADYPELSFHETALRLATTHATNPDRDETRGIRALDSLRSFESPDDILVILDRGRLQAEGVWMTLHHFDGTSLFATLVTEPFENFGVHAGDLCRLRLHSGRLSGKVLATIDC